MNVQRLLQSWWKGFRRGQPKPRSTVFGPVAEPLEDRCLLSTSSPLVQVPQPLRSDTFALTWEDAGRAIRLNLPGVSRNVSSSSAALVLTDSTNATALLVAEDLNRDGLPDV